MKNKGFNYMKKRFFSLLLCAALLCGLALPNMAFAAGNHNIGDTVEFAGHDWYIIGTESEGVTAPEGCYTLFAKNNDFGSTAFRAGANTADSTANHYKDSDLQKKMVEIAKGFSAEDKANIAARDTLDGIAGDSPTGQLLWPVSEAEFYNIGQNLGAFPEHYWTRAYRNGGYTLDNVYVSLYNGWFANANGKWLGAGLGNLEVNGNPVTGTYAVRPALYVKAEALKDDVVIPPIVIPGTEFTLQPQTQYAVEGGSITFTAEATTAGVPITEIAKYQWQAQLPGSESWYDLYVWSGDISMLRYGQTLTIHNVSGTFTDNGLILSEGNDTLVKDCLFRCVANGGLTGTAYSEPGNIIVVAGGGGQGGEDGQDGITPQLRINPDTNIWEVSYDNGATWDSLDVNATGEDGKQIELRVENEHIQWRYENGTWENLLPLSALQGAPGQDGQDGKDGVTPQLRINPDTNMWEVSYDNGATWTSLNVPATGADGQDGQDGAPGQDGQDGKPGDTPTIGANGNWWIGGVDTGVSAAGSDGSDGSDGSNGKDGQDGKDGADGKDGKDGQDGLTPYIGGNGNWWIGSTDTGIKAAGTNGVNGADGKDGTDGRDGTNGKDGVGVQSVAVNDEGELVITLTDGSVHNVGKVVGADGKDGREIELQNNGEYLQWRYAGETEWNNLIAISELQGADGRDGAQTVVYVLLGASLLWSAALTLLLLKRKMLIGK